MRVSELWLHPVKGCRGIAVESMELDEVGPLHDRRWMIVDPDGRFRSQRGHPRMALVTTTLLPDALELGHPELPPLRIPLEAGAGPVLEVEVWSDRLPAATVSPEADAWVSRALGDPSHLVRLDEGRAVRSTHPDYAAGGKVGFADGFPVLLASQESLDELNRRLDSPVTMRRFRANVVVEGTPGPHAEDHWRRILVGDMAFRVVKACARCSVPAVDPDTGVRGKEPTRTLAGYRRYERLVWFGQNAVHEAPGRLALGDLVEVVEVGSPRPGPLLA